MLDPIIIISVLGLGICIGTFIGLGIAFAIGKMVGHYDERNRSLEEVIPEDLVVRVAEIMAQKMEVK